MRFFFRSKKFKSILAVVLCLAVLSAVCFFIGGRMSPQSDLLGTIASPFEAFGVKIVSTFSDWSTRMRDGAEAQLKNAELEAEIEELRSRLVDYETIKAENDFYKNYLELKDAHPDFTFVDAKKIASDKNDPYQSFTVNKGSLSGIENHDPVITEAGLVGYVSEVGLNTCKVTTVLSPDISLGILDNRTSDAGVLNGSLTAAEQNLTGMINLSRSCSVAVGDYVITSGEGVFPEGLMVGTIQSIGSEKNSTSIYATVKPFVELKEIRNVMVLTSFQGQGGLDPTPKKGE